MKLKDLFESSSEVKLGDLEINGEIVAPYEKRREEWVGSLAVYNGDLTSLEGAPKKVSGYFYCADKKRLTSLVGGPEEVGEYYSCNDCDLASLEGAPKKVSATFSCNRNKRLTSLIGGPEEVGGHYSCRSCDLTSLEGAPKKISGSFYCDGNKRLTSIAGIHKRIKEIEGIFRCDSDLSGPVLGLLKIKKLRKVVLKDQELTAILNKYLPEGDLIDCQQELIDAGYEEQAKL